MPKTEVIVLLPKPPHSIRSYKTVTPKKVKLLKSTFFQRRKFNLTNIFSYYFLLFYIFLM